ncbi:MAG: hypothetical protein KatS3mg121_1207 [Gammaproteobacteria bacterium]|nr:MAG: hypothetical protein KatS3mg121_1207 [Gammaproteobacteria bacterium]
MRGVGRMNRSGPKRLALAGALCLCSLGAAAAQCEYIVTNEWNTGFTAAIRIHNDGTAPIDGWSVSWSYGDGSRRTSGWNAEVTGNNPYTATPLSWNRLIQPGQAVEFGIQGSKGTPNAPAPVPPVSGSVCGGGSSSAPSSSSSSSPPPSSSSSSSAPSSSSSSSPPPSSSSSSSAPSSSSSSAPGGWSTAPVPPAVELRRVFPNLNFNQPLGLLQAPGDDTRWYVLEKPGTVYWIDAGNDQTNIRNVYIDLSGQVNANSEGGVLGMAFHPNYPLNRRVYLSFTVPSNSAAMTSVIAEFTETADRTRLDLASRRDILTMDQPYANHNGGQITFGPDGYLYIAFGDGGSANDPLDDAQDTSNWRGAMLRIDVDAGSPYGIPPDNPFIGGGGLPEIYAYGLRNPWRWSFDRLSGQLWVADVGQAAWEEIDIIQAGGNYGWRCREGFAVTSNACSTSGPYVDPIAVYDHSEGASITGGYVYRGGDIIGLDGIYVFGDYANGRIWGITQPTPGDYQRHLMLDTNLAIASFGESNQGELYVVDFGGGLYRLLPQGGLSSSSSSSSSSTPSSSSSSSPPPSSSSSSSSPPPPSSSSSSSSAPGAGAYCDVDYVIANDWGSGFQVNLTIHNLSNQVVDGWTLVWNLGAGESFAGGWNASFGTSGSQVTASNPAGHWNGRLAANGGTVSFGFQVNNSQPPADLVTEFTLNGTPCGQPPASSSSSGGGASSGSSSSAGSSSSGGLNDGQNLYGLHCASCHGFDGAGGTVGVPLDQPQDLAAMTAYIETNMPMTDPAACGADCAAAVANYIADTFWTPTEPLVCSGVRYGAQQLKLLTRSEYQNSVEDLLGVDYAAADGLAPDTRVGYFHNNSYTAVLESSYDRYLTVAQEIAAWSAARDFAPALDCNGVYDQSCAERFLDQVLPRIFRRPPDAAEEGAYRNLANGTATGGDVKAGIELALAAALSSPQFLYRSEIGEPNPANPELGADATELTSYEMATWLAYTFTGSTPDDTLLARAAADELRDPAVIRAEADRLLATPRARERLGDFVGAWLDTDALENAPKDPTVWPGFEQLIPHLEREIREVFAYVMLTETERFASLYAGDFTFVNGPLAQHYGIGGVTGEAFQRVTTPDRGGILTSGAFMARWAEDVESSPIRRSVRVRRRMLCQNQPAPPANVALGREQQLAENAAILNDPTTTNRRKYEVITDASPCSDCHAEWINPLGFGMEDFDAVGRRRSQDLNGNPIDASGRLYAPENLNDRATWIDFSGARGLGEVLAGLPAAQSCLTEQLFRYVYGVGPENIDPSNPQGPQLDPQERNAYLCEVQDLTQRMMSTSPRAMLRDMAVMQAVRYRKPWSR